MLPKVCAVVAAAGSGRRFGADKNKLFLQLGGKPVIVRTIEALEASPVITDILPVAREEDMAHVAGLVDEYGLSKVMRIIPGGPERQDSVYNALKSIGDEDAMVLIHDGGRPFATPDMFSAAVLACEGFDGIIAAVRVKDTIKEIEGAPPEGSPAVVRRTLERGLLYAVQTPQVFHLKALMRAHEQAGAEKFYATDDAALVERYGGRIGIIEGSYRNIKITTPEDLVIAEALLKVQAG
jgi:2-C-methyl-D-erythritol 4-phosphate cytidylyltransferase